MTAAAPPLTDPISLAYLQWCADQEVPPNTIRRRKSALRTIVHAGTASRDDIETWWASRRHLSPVTRANDLAVVRSFYRWCARWDHRYDDPTARLEPPTTQTGAPQPPSRREFARIVAYVKDKPPLLRAVLLATYAGLRREEIARLTWADIDHDALRARVLGKGNKVRWVRLTERLYNALMPADGSEPDDSLNVVTGKVKGWTPDTLGRKVNAAIRAAGVNATIHKLRHRYGSVGYQKSLDPRALADQMGHASPATTLKFYAAADDDAGLAIADAVADDGIEF